MCEEYFIQFTTNASIQYKCKLIVGILATQTDDACKGFVSRQQALPTNREFVTRTCTTTDFNDAINFHYGNNAVNGMGGAFAAFQMPLILALAYHF
uniref:Uncharacterized protein n=1 Tax=Glossina pallidipes TaxID=7398 RepID=A0A1A9ZVQ1_GLOPL